MVRGQRTADQPRGPAAGTGFLDGLDGRFLEGGLIGQAQVIIGGKVKISPALDLKMRRLRGIDAAQFPEQILFAQIAQT